MVTSQKCPVTSFRLNIDQKMVQFWKVASANLKIRKLSVPSTTSNFQELFVMKFDSKSTWLEAKMPVFSEVIYHKKKEEGKNAPPACKI